MGICDEKWSQGNSCVIISVIMLWCTCARTTGGCKDKCIGLLTASPNVEAEFVLGSHVSLNMGIAANPISTDNF